MKVIVLLTTVTAMIAACGTTPPFPSQNSEKYSFYQERCGSCHAPIAPEHHESFQWERLLILMERGLELQHGEMEPLSAKDKETLLEYLKAFSYKDRAAELKPQE